jgi:hypothetical protein
MPIAIKSKFQTIADFVVKLVIAIEFEFNLTMNLYLVRMAMFEEDQKMK